MSEPEILTCRNCGKQYRHTRLKKSGYCPDKPCQQAYGREKAKQAAGPLVSTLERNMDALAQANEIMQSLGYEAAAEFCRQNGLHNTASMYSRRVVNAGTWLEAA